MKAPERAADAALSWLDAARRRDRAASPAAAQWSGSSLMAAPVGACRCRPCAARRPARRDTALSVAPVIAPTSSWLDASGIEDAVVAPEPQHDDAVGHGAHVLHVVADHDRRRARGRARRSIRFSTSAVCATPSAAVGSSRRISLGLAAAASGRSRRSGAARRRARRRRSRTLGMRAESSLQQRPGPDLHRHLVEPQRAQLAAEEDVGDDVEVLAEREVLEHRRDAECDGAAPGRAIVTSLPPKVIVPALGGCTPARILTRVDLPAPLSPDQRDDLAGVRRRGRCRSARRRRRSVLRDAAQAQHRAAACRPFG